MSGDATAVRLTWAAGFAVALGAAIATAHGLYEVARAAGAPVPIAGLYPLITDGLALVAYATTMRLDAAGRRYAWTIVVLAAGLSGLAQAAFLAGGVHSAPGWLRFGVGAWPAVAAALVAHLLYLLAEHSGRTYNVQSVRSMDGPALYDRTDAVNAEVPDEPDPPVVAAPPAAHPAPKPSSPAGDRARSAAREHQAQHGALPTASELMELADVARGTAGTVLKQLRDERPALQIVNPSFEPKTQR